MKLNKAILYKDLKNTKLLWIFMIFIMLFFNFKSFNNNFILYNSNVENLSWFNNALFTSDSYAFIFIASLILSCILFIHEKSNSSYGFVFSMPFTKKELLINKWCLGVFIIFSTCMINMIIVFLFYFSKLSFINTTFNPTLDITQYFVLCFFVSSLLFTIGMFFQTIMGNIILSGTVAGIFLAVPQFIISSIIANLNSYHKEFYFHIINFLNSLVFILSPYLYFSVNNKYEKINNVSVCTYHLKNFSLNIFLCIILTFIFLILSIYCFNKRNLERNNNIAITNNLEFAFKICTSICVALALITFLDIIKYSIALFFILFICLSFISYIFINKLINKLY